MSEGISLRAPFSFGDRVIIDDDESLVGRVIAFTFRSDFAQVEVAWLHNGGAQSAWFDNWRLSPAPEKAT